jgi:hypothetical protein
VDSFVCPCSVKFVSQQLESAFFGAVTSVAALFDFKPENKKREGEKKWDVG